jgi:hypothetical protein
MIHNKYPDIVDFKTYDRFIYNTLDNVRHKIFGKFSTVKTKEDSIRVITEYIQKLIEALGISISDETAEFTEQLKIMVNSDVSAIDKMII